MKPSIPQGTRDFLPETIEKRSFIFNTIRQVFETYGYVPIETPTMENLSTLTGKYGDEGDQLLFKVLNNGDFLSKANEKDLVEKNSKAITPSISKRGLRYDLTVPFARYVVMHRNDISFPFKRYQIQPVWRADRPQKGRYREFYQCDVDVVGSNSLFYESELITIYQKVFELLGINVDIQINNRKILTGIFDILELDDDFASFTTILDKLDKIGLEGISKAYDQKGYPLEKINKIKEIFSQNDLSYFSSLFENSEIGLKGVEEIKEVLDTCDVLLGQDNVRFLPTLARGLSYYTGCIFEVKALDASIGSIGGGGRYDNLTSMFGLDDVSGVGVSFGAERIYDVMESLSLFPEKVSNKGLRVLLISASEEAFKYNLNVLKTLRENNIEADIYPEPVKFKKQFKYANQRNAKHIIVTGDQELEEKVISLKNFETGEQEKMSLQELIKKLKIG